VISGKTSLKFVTEHKQVAQLYRPRWRRRLAAAAHALGLSVLLAGGTVWTMQQQKPHYTRPSALLALPGAVISAIKPSEDPFRISQVLRRYTRTGAEADKIAKAVVSEGRVAEREPPPVPPLAGQRQRDGHYDERESEPPYSDRDWIGGGESNERPGEGDAEQRECENPTRRGAGQEGAAAT